VQPPSERVRDLVSQAMALWSVRPHEARQLAEEALALAEAIGDPEGAARAWVAIGQARWAAGERAEGLRAIETGLARFLPAEPQLWQAQAVTLYGMAMRHAGRHVEAAESARRAVALARHVGDSRLEGSAHNNLGLALFELGDHDQALAEYLQTLTILDELDAPDEDDLRCTVYANVAEILADRGDFAEAAEQLERAIAFRGPAPPPWVLRLGRRRATYLRRAGRLEEAQAQLQRWIPHVEAAGDRAIPGTLERCLAEQAVLAGHLPAAAQHYRDALAREARTQSARQLARLGLELAAVLDPASDEVLTLAEAASARGDLEGGGVLKYEAVRRLSDHHEARGDLAAALRYAREAERWQRVLFDQSRTRQVSELQARLDLAQRGWEARWHRSRNEELTRRVDERTAELREARDRAQAADRMKTVFLASASHELRTPLNAITGYGELIRELAQDGAFDEIGPSSDRLLESAARLLHLVDRILQLTDLEAGAIAPQPSAVALPALLEAIVEAVGPAAARQENTLTVRCAPDAQEVHTDRALLETVVFNLVDNAAKFTRGGEVRLIGLRRGDRIVVRVEDTGIGMPPDHVARLFQPFTQLEAGFTRRFDGLGLGLALCRRSCQLLGGELRVESVLGRGSAFELVLPSGS
jgi:signal transduction histidine kinase